MLNSSIEKWYFFTTMILLLASMIVPSYGQIDLKSVKFYDKYGSEASVAYADGYMKIRCTHCTAGQDVQLLANGQTLKSQDCDPAAGVIFRLDITGMNFGKYKCRHNDVDSDQEWDFEYRLCNHEECMKTECTDNNTFCVVEADKTTDCGHPDKGRCRQHEKSDRGSWLFCAKSDTYFCQAIATDTKYLKVWVEQNASSSCGSETDDAGNFAHTKYNNHPFRYGEPIKLNSTFPHLLFHCVGNFHESKITCVIKGSDGIQLHSSTTANCLGTHAHTLPDEILKSGHNIFKLECNLTSNDTKVHGRLSNLLISSAGNVVITKHPDRGQYIDSMECNFDPHPPSDFKVNCNWKGTKNVDPAQKDGKLDVTETDNYTCTCTIVYQSCSPYKRIVHQNSSGSIHAIPNPQRTTTTSIPKTSNGSSVTLKTETAGNDSVGPSTTPAAVMEDTTESETMKTVAFAMIGVLVPLCIVGCVVLFFCIRVKRRYEREDAQRKVAPKVSLNPVESPKFSLNLVKSPKAHNQVELTEWAKARTDIATKLKEESEAIEERWKKQLKAKVITAEEFQLKIDAEKAKKLTLDKELLDYNKEMNAEDKPNDTSGTIHASIPGSRYPIDTLLATQVVLKFNKQGLSMNRMKDFHGNTILMCQAPYKKDCHLQWEAIFQEKVGVIVWIGQLTEDEGEKIYPYAPRVEGHKQMFHAPAKKDPDSLGPSEPKQPIPSPQNPVFTIQTTTVIPKEKGCNTYLLDAKRAIALPAENGAKRANAPPAESGERRPITLIHIPDWPDWTVLKDKLGLAKAVAHIADQQKVRAERGLPGLLIHCSGGFQRSIAVLVMYLGRQMWLHSGVVHPMGILKYIRRHRHLALSSELLEPALLTDQMALIGGVLQVICTRAAEQLGGKMTTDSVRDNRVLGVRSVKDDPKTSGDQSKVPQKCFVDPRKKTGTVANTSQMSGIRPTSTSKAGDVKGGSKSKKK